MRNTWGQSPNEFTMHTRAERQMLPHRQPARSAEVDIALQAMRPQRSDSLSEP